MTQTHSRPIRALMCVLRRVMPHQLKDVENVRLQEGDPIVYLCNHGEMYGPIAERDRIVDEAYNQMQALYDREEALCRA